MYKDFQNRHTDLNQGEDMRSNKKLFDNKAKKMQEKVQQSRIEDSKNKKQSLAGTKRTYSEKAIGKIHKASRPTKSKMIIKGGGSRGGRDGGSRGGRGGSRGSSRGGRGGSRGGRGGRR
jgi:hypothetical protein